MAAPSSRNSSLRSLLLGPQVKHASGNCRERVKFRHLPRLRLYLGVVSYQSLVRVRDFPANRRCKSANPPAFHAAMFSKGMARPFKFARSLATVARQTGSPGGAKDSSPGRQSLRSFALGYFLLAPTGQQTGRRFPFEYFELLAVTFPVK